MFPDWVSNPGPLTYESDALPIALCGQASNITYSHLVSISISQGKLLKLLTLSNQMSCYISKGIRILTTIFI